MKWRCGPITAADVRETVQARILEERSGQQVNGSLTQEENRIFHLQRLATLFFLAPQNAVAAPETNPNFRIHLILMFAGALLQNAWLDDGNHRVAAASLRGDKHLEIEIITADRAHITDVLPGAVLVE